MKKEKFYLDKFFVIQLTKVLVLQALFAIITILFAAGGHGTSLPGIILYGPILVVLWLCASILPTSVPVTTSAILFSMTLPVMVFLIIFLIFYFKFPSRNFLKLLLLSHWSGVVLLLVYTQLTYGDTPYLIFSYKIFAILASLILSFFFWRIFFQVLNHKNQSFVKNAS